MTASTPQPFTLRAAAGLPSLPPPLADSALVLIDAQQEYGPDGRLPLPGLADALDVIDGLLVRARDAGTPIIHVLHEGRAGAPFDPSAGGRPLEAAAPRAGEHVVTKTLPNSFAGTDLEAALGALGRPPLVLTGFMTHMCVSSTARAALDLGLSTTVVADATASRTLPLAGGDGVIEAHDVHRSALAALADRFSIVVAADRIA